MKLATRLLLSSLVFPLSGCPEMDALASDLLGGAVEDGGAIPGPVEDEACVTVDPNWPRGPSIATVEAEVGQGVLAAPTARVSVVASASWSSGNTSPATLRVSPSGRVAGARGYAVAGRDPFVELIDADGTPLSTRVRELRDDDRAINSGRFIERNGVEVFEVLTTTIRGDAFVEADVLGADGSARHDVLLHGSAMFASVARFDDDTLHGLFIQAPGPGPRDLILYYAELDETCGLNVGFGLADFPIGQQWIAMLPRRDGEPELVSLGENGIYVGRPQVSMWTHLPGPFVYPEQVLSTRFGLNGIALSYGFTAPYDANDQHLLVRSGSAFTSYGLRSDTPMCTADSTHPACEHDVTGATWVHGLASDGDVAWWATATAFDLEGDEELCPGRPHEPTQLRLFRIDDDGVREFAVPGVFPRTVAIAVSPTTVPGQLYIALVHGGYVAPQCDGADYKLERLTVEVPQD